MPSLLGDHPSVSSVALKFCLNFSFCVYHNLAVLYAHLFASLRTCCMLDSTPLSLQVHAASIRVRHKWFSSSSSPFIWLTASWQSLSMKIHVQPFSCTNLSICLRSHSFAWIGVEVLMTPLKPSIHFPCLLLTSPPKLPQLWFRSSSLDHHTM